MEITPTELDYCIEDSIIASLVQNNDFLDEITSEIKLDDFSKQLNREIYETFLDLQSKSELPVDVLQLCDKIKSDRYSSDDALCMIAEMTLGHVFGFESFKAHIAMLKTASNRRKTMSLLNETQKIISTNKSDGIEFLRKGIDEIENNQSVVICPFSDNLDKTILEIEKLSSSENDLNGLGTGFENIDSLTGGLQKSDLIVLAARPSMGKTALALNMAQNISAHNGKSVVFFSLEMQTGQIMKRTLCRFANIEGERMFAGRLNSEDWKRIQFCQPFLSKSKLFINDRSMLTVSEMRSYCRKIKNTHGLDAVFIDYISFVQVTQDIDSEVRRLAIISSQLKSLAKDFDVPVVILSQLNRNVESRKEKRPIMADIRDSGAIEQDADVIMFLYREERYNNLTPKKGEAELIIEKNRNGKTGTAMLKCNLSRFEFMDYGQYKSESSKMFDQGSWPNYR